MGAVGGTLLRSIALLSIFLLVSAPVVCAWAEYNMAPIVSIRDIRNNPSFYDSTFMRNLIAITGTIEKMSPDELYIMDDGETLWVTLTSRNQMVGFAEGDKVKLVGYYFKPRNTPEYFEPVYVMRYPVQHASTSVEELAAHPEKYNGDVVSVKGRLTKVERISEFQFVMLLDGSPYPRVKYSGLTVLKEGAVVSVEGLLNYRTIYADEVKELTPLMQLLSYMRYLLAGLAAMVVVYLVMRRI